MPNNKVLADIYHVSAITMRHTITLLNKLGMVKTLNGVDTRIIFMGDSTIPYKLKDFLLDDSLKIFMDALQLSPSHANP